MNTLVDATLHDLIVGSQPYHVGVFQAPKDTITHVQNIYNAWASGSNVEAAFTAYPMLRTIFQMLRRPGHPPRSRMLLANLEDGTRPSRNPGTKGAVVRPSRRKCRVSAAGEIQGATGDPT